MSSLKLHSAPLNTGDSFMYITASIILLTNTKALKKNMCIRCEKVLTGGTEWQCRWIIAWCLVLNSGSLRPCRGAAVLQVGCLPPHTHTHTHTHNTQLENAPREQRQRREHCSSPRRNSRSRSHSGGGWGGDNRDMMGPHTRIWTPHHHHHHHHPSMLLLLLLDFLMLRRKSKTFPLQGCSARMGLSQPSLMRSCWE